MSTICHIHLYKENATKIMNTCRGFYLVVYVACGAAAAYPSEAQELTPGF